MAETETQTVTVAAENGGTISLAAKDAQTTDIPLEVTEDPQPITTTAETQSQAVSMPAPRVSFKTPGTQDNHIMPSKIRTDSTSSAPISEFQRFLPNVPWQQGFWAGAGVNAFTGQVEPSPVVPFTLTPNETKQSRELFTSIRYESNLMQELSAAAGAGLTLNIGQIGLGFEANTSLLSRAKVSATSASILATYMTTYDPDFDPASEYKLKPEAAELARTNPEEFRKRYGDYFIAGGQRTSSFTALLVYSCTNLETLQTFATNVAASVSDLFKLVGSAGWAEKAREANVEIKVYVEMRGYTGSPPGPSGTWDASKVVDALNWFKAHEVGAYSNARLQHYSVLDNNISRAIPISGEIFKDIRRLHILLRSISILAGSCPETTDSESTRLVTVADELCQEVESHQSALAMDTALCARHLQAANALHDQLSSLHRRYSFWVQVFNKIPDQPRHRIDAAKNQQNWSYGFSSYPPDPTIEILSTEHTLVLKWSLSPLKRDGTLSYAGDRLIVGWKVVSVRNDGNNGSWRRLASSVLLSNSARIVFRTKPFRSSDWKLVTYHVDQRQFNFVGTGIEWVTLGDDNDDPTLMYPGKTLKPQFKDKLPHIGRH